MQKCSCPITKDAGPFVSKYYHGWCRNIHLKITVHPSHCVQLRGEISKKLKCVPREGLPVQYLRWRFETKGILKSQPKSFPLSPKILVTVNSSPPCGSNFYQIFWIHEKLNVFVNICTFLFIDFIQSLKLMTYLFTHPSSFLSLQSLQSFSRPNYLCINLLPPTHLITYLQRNRWLCSREKKTKTYYLLHFVQFWKMYIQK